MSKKLGIVITDGVGYRNYILSDFVRNASANFKEVIIYSGLKESVYDLDAFPNVKVVELEVYKESRKVWFYRKLHETSHLYKHRSFFGMNDTIQNNRPKGYSKRAIINRCIRLVASIYHTEGIMKKYQSKIYKLFANHRITKDYIQFLKRDQPDILFFTHQRPPYIAPLVYAATTQNIKTCSFIFSWDNLASKGRMPAMFDSFLVWSDLMKEELKYFYPFVDKNKIFVVGTPQFEPYIMDDYKISKEDFYKNFKLNPAKKTICFSCGDTSTGANDPLAIKIISEAIAEGKIEEPINLIVRTSPADDGSRFKDSMDKHPSISWNKPKWVLTRENHVEEWSQRVPLKEDIRDLRSLIEHADLSINMCSTMSLDFMLFDKPVINQVLGSKENGLFFDQKYLNYVHYKKVVDSNSVLIARNEDELIDMINRALKNPDEKQKEREDILNTEIGKPLEGTSKRIVEALLSLI